jgi:hypothetical protein
MLNGTGEFSGAEKEIWAAIQAMNRLWTIENRPEELRHYFHASMVAITPSDRHRLEGREACVAGWTRFAHMAKTVRWVEKEPQIQVFEEKFAVATYTYEGTFIIGGKETSFQGRDMMTLLKEGGKWWMIADQFSPYPAR